MLIVQAGMDKAVPWTQLSTYRTTRQSYRFTGECRRVLQRLRVGKGPCFSGKHGQCNFPSPGTPAQGDYADPDTVTRAAETLPVILAIHVQNLAARKMSSNN